MIKSPLMQPATIYFWIFCSHYGFLYYFEMISFLSSNNTPARASPGNRSSWLEMYFKWNKALKTIKFFSSTIFWNLLWSKFWNIFQAEIIPWNPMFLDFLTVFYMVWKNQESFYSWLVGFWASRCSKMPKISFNNFFFVFELSLWIY